MNYTPDSIYRCLGFLYRKQRAVYPEDYFDFENKTWEFKELQQDLRFGVLPPGMLLRSPGGQVYVILNAKLVPLDAALKVVK